MGHLDWGREHASLSPSSASPRRCWSRTSRCRRTVPASCVHTGWCVH